MVDEELDAQAQWLIEQISAAKEVIHSYKCYSCQIASAQTLVLLVDNDAEDGCSVTMVGICGTCKEAE